MALELTGPSSGEYGKPVARAEVFRRAAEPTVFKRVLRDTREFMLPSITQ